MPSRRNILIALGGSATAGGIAFGTSAFDSVSANRSATVSVVGDANAYLGLQPLELDTDADSPNTVDNNQYANTDSDELALTFTSVDGGGDGFGQNSTYRIDDLFRITNQSPEEITLSYALGEDNTSSGGEDNSPPNVIDQFNLRVTGESSGIESGSTPTVPYELNETNVPSGEHLDIGVEVDTSEYSDGKVTEQNFDVNITAGDLSEAQGGDGSNAVTLNQDIINEADSGSKIVVKDFAGGSLNINTAGLTLSGVGRPALDTGKQNRNAISVTAPGVTMENFEIASAGTSGSGNLGAVVNAGDSAGGFTLRNCTIRARDESAGGLIAFPTTTIENCTFVAESDGPGYGIRFANDESTAGSTVSNCSIGEEGEGAFETGIFVTNTENIDILDSVITNNTDGIYLQRAERGNNENPVDLSDIEIKRNDITDNSEIGVVIGGRTGTGIEINRNNIVGSGNVGLGPAPGADQDAVQNGFEDVDATENWWGNVAGPNPVLGDGVTQNADVVPWLDAPYDEDGEPITEQP